jgi:hypothetical protein
MRKPSRVFQYHSKDGTYSVKDYTGTKWKNDPVVRGRIELQSESIYKMNGSAITLV